MRNSLVDFAITVAAGTRLLIAMGGVLPVTLHETMHLKTWQKLLVCTASDCQRRLLKPYTLFRGRKRSTDMAENDAPERLWVGQVHGSFIGVTRYTRVHEHKHFDDDVEYTRTDLAAPNAAQVGKLLDAWELLPNDVKSDLRREFPSFADSITNLFQSVPRKGNNE